MDSPLLFPVRLEGNTIFVLDETRIPFTIDYIEVSDLNGALWVLKEMKTRSLGQVLLFFYSCLLFRNDFSIDEIAEKFKSKRSTFDFILLAQILKDGMGKGAGLEAAIKNFIQGFDAARRERAKRLAGMLSHPANILTICNVNGELIYLYEELKKLNKEGFFYVSETRPYLQGARLTFWELRKHAIPCQLICDNQAAILMQEGKVNCVITGADRSTTKGDVINKIGTYFLARLAGHFGIPFYPLIQYPKDINVDGIPIEERPSQEVFMFLEGDYKDMNAVYPCFDIVKSDFVTKPILLALQQQN